MTVADGKSGRDCRHDKVKTAKLLGIGLKTLYRKLKTYGGCDGLITNRATARVAPTIGNEP